MASFLDLADPIGRIIMLSMFPVIIFSIARIDFDFKRNKHIYLINFIVVSAFQVLDSAIDIATLTSYLTIFQTLFAWLFPLYCRRNQENNKYYWMVVYLMMINIFYTGLLGWNPNPGSAFEQILDIIHVTVLIVVMYQLMKKERLTNEANLSYYLND